jgi:hypothetical protein
MVKPIVVGIVGAALVTSRVVFWRDHGWRAEVTIDESTVILSDFVADEDAARRVALKALLEAAEKFALALDAGP